MAQKTILTLSESFYARVVKAVRWVEGQNRNGLPPTGRGPALQGSLVPVIVQLFAEVGGGVYKARIVRRALPSAWEGSDIPEADWVDWREFAEVRAENVTGGSLVVGTDPDFKRYVGLIVGKEGGYLRVSVVAAVGSAVTGVPGVGVWVTSGRDAVNGGDYYPAKLYRSWDVVDDTPVLGDDVWYSPAAGDLGVVPGLYVAFPAGDTVGEGGYEHDAYIGETFGEAEIEVYDPDGDVTLGGSAPVVCDEDGNAVGVDLSGVTVTLPTRTKRVRAVGLTSEDV